eukprot:1144279-Pelagomonas_calceolata.AAC.2
MSPLHCKATKQKVLMGSWRVNGSTRLQNLTVRRYAQYTRYPTNAQENGLKSHSFCIDTFAEVR